MNDCIHVSDTPYGPLCCLKNTGCDEKHCAVKDNATISEEIHTLLETHDNTFLYQLLDRMRQDCAYYLSFGGRHNKYLWAGNPDAQILYMKAIWTHFKEGEKPEWLTMEDIEGFETKMKEDLKDASISG
ncbi:LPD11 domain-containing protein [Clostridium porci]|uniref:LPD11 domain-containing protein n=1 Tax=Clostridium porci TaxID=2605778 RepID=UPI0018A6C58C|nr:LPD11 domain-containing protein [Clostridium porci]